MIERTVFVPGGGMPPDASVPVVNEYSRLLDLEIDLIPYPEYAVSGFKITIDNYKKYFHKVVQNRYGNDKLMVIGFSLGAYFALDLVSDENLDIDSLILISPYLRKPGNALGVVLNRGKSFFDEQSTYADWYSYNPKDLADDYFHYGGRIISQFINVVSKLKYEKKAFDSDVRKLVVIGEHDTVIPKYLPDELSMKNTKVVYVAGQHDILTHKNSELPGVLKSFLRETK